MAQEDKKKREHALACAVKRVQDGNLEAYDEVYRLCDGPLHSILGSRHTRRGERFVDEVAIRTLEYGFEHRDEYKPDKGTSFLTWLVWQSFNVAKKVWAEWNDPNTVNLDEELDVQYVLTTSDPAEELERQRRNQVLRQELKTLAEQDRLSIAGHGSGHWTFSTTAQRLGLTVPKARYRYERARRDMKERLERRGVRPTEVVPCYGRVGSMPDDTGDDGDRGAMPMASLPTGPGSPEGAAAVEVEKEVPSD